MSEVRRSLKLMIEFAWTLTNLLSFGITTPTINSEVSQIASDRVPAAILIIKPKHLRAVLKLTRLYNSRNIINSYWISLKRTDGLSVRFDEFIGYKSVFHNCLCGINCSAWVGLPTAATAGGSRTSLNWLRFNYTTNWHRPKVLKFPSLVCFIARPICMLVTHRSFVNAF